MNDLLTLAVNARGSLVRWSQFKTVSASMSMEGALWEAKGHLPEMKDLRVEGLCSPGSRVNVETENGRLLDFRVLRRAGV